MHYNTIPISLKDANKFVEDLHRHHVPVVIDKYRVAAERDGRIVGVVQVNRPVSRVLDDGETLEVVRLCTDGSPNACTFLYSKAIAIAKIMGYKRMITYTLESERGVSLLASGFKLDGITRGGEWSCPSRRRRPVDNPCRKKRWIKIFKE